mmetsp:Transcript_16195/g.29169  ORF Transcript_16195/g.29169 Transcript_16195/m.29169 type:complete len:155 (-) Transcript_16195:4594-5058(-)
MVVKGVGARGGDGGGGGGRVVGWVERKVKEEGEGDGLKSRVVEETRGVDETILNVGIEASRDGGDAEAGGDETGGEEEDKEGGADGATTWEEGEEVEDVWGGEMEEEKVEELGFEKAADIEKRWFICCAAKSLPPPQGINGAATNDKALGGEMK